VARRLLASSQPKKQKNNEKQGFHGGKSTHTALVRFLASSLPANSCSFDSVRLYGIIWMAQFANENFEKVR
jgi:hypothetical protein